MSSVETVFWTQWAREIVQTFQEKLVITDFLNVFVQQDVQQQIEQEQAFQNLEVLWSEWIQRAHDFETISFPTDWTVAPDADSNKQQDSYASSVRPLSPLTPPNKRAEVQTNFLEAASMQREVVPVAPSPFLRRVPTVMPSVAAVAKEPLTNVWVTPSSTKTQEIVPLPTEAPLEVPFSNAWLDALPPTPKNHFEHPVAPASTLEMTAPVTTPLTVTPLVRLDDAAKDSFVFPDAANQAVWESSEWNLDLKSTKSPIAALPVEQTAPFAAKNKAETVEPSLDAPILGAKMPTSVLRRVLPTAVNAQLSKNLDTQTFFEEVPRSTQPVAAPDTTEWNHSKSSNLPTNTIHTQKATSLPQSEIRNPKSEIPKVSGLKEQEQEPIGTENNDIWQKPLGNLSNFAAFANFAVESESVDDFSHVAEKPVTPLEVSHEELKSFQMEASFSTFEETTAAPVPTFDKKTVSPVPTFDKKMVSPVPIFEQTSITPHAPPPQTPQRVEEWSDFFQKTTEDTSASLQTSVLLEALTQRIAQDFKRFYP